ncbi:MAG TPA: hypothetical protein VKR06_09145 [Ktedonosporobacter sp.]|nr:hypothetical protein [Ktedonosporobacter sp.]
MSSRRPRYQTPDLRARQSLELVGQAHRFVAISGCFHPSRTPEHCHHCGSLLDAVLEDVALARMEQFRDHLGLYLAALRELSDPDIASAQIEAAHHRAHAQIAAA